MEHVDLLTYIRNKHSILAIGGRQYRREEAALARLFIEKGLEAGERVVYVATKQFPQDILKTYHLDAGEIISIDCYSSCVGIPTTNGSSVLSVSSPFAINELQEALVQVIESPTRIVLEATPLMHYATEAFFEGLPETVIKTNSTMLILLDAHAAKIALLDSIASETLRFGNGTIEVSSLAERQQWHYELAGHAILLKEASKG